MRADPSFVRTALRVRRAQLLRRIREQVQQSRDPVALALVHAMPDTDTSALADRLIDLNLTVLGREIAEIRDIDAALTQLITGTYGDCSECGQPIDAARLCEQPAVQRCLACRTAFEARRGIVRGTTIACDCTATSPLKGNDDA